MPQGNAMAQLKTKNYAAKYLAEGQPIYLIGVEFSKEARNIVAFEVESVDSVDTNAINFLTNS